MSNGKLLEKTPYERLKILVLGGEFLPGERITEANLAEKLEISRIPVREAIQQLILEGFIRRSEKSGYQITEYNEQNIIDLYNYREALDGMLARLYTQKADVSQLYFLEMNTENMKNVLEQFNHDDFLRIDQEFHRIIARGAKNPVMEQQHELMLQKIQYVQNRVYLEDEEKEDSILDAASFQETYRQHRKIFDAIKAKDPDAAEKAARESVQKGLKKALLILSKSF